MQEPGFAEIESRCQKIANVSGPLVCTVAKIEAASEMLNLCAKDANLLKRSRASRLFLSAQTF